MHITTQTDSLCYKNLRKLIIHKKRINTVNFAIFFEKRLDIHLSSTSIRTALFKNKRLSYLISVQSCRSVILVRFHLLFTEFSSPSTITLNYIIRLQIFAVLPLLSPHVLRLARSLSSRVFVVALENLQCLSIYYFSRSVVNLPHRHYK